MRKFAMAIVGAAVACSAARADITISNKPTENMTCSGGVCTATAKKAVLNASDLANMLASGDATVKSGIAKSIPVDQLLSWETTSRLTLDATIHNRQQADHRGRKRGADDCVAVAAQTATCSSSARVRLIS